MQVRDVISGKTVFLRPEDNLERAIGLFQATRLEAAPVIEKDMKVIGIFTKSNLFQSLLEGHRLDEPVRDFMNTEVVAVRPEMSFAEISEELRTTPVGQAVVTTADGRLAGMLTKVDVINALLDRTDFLASELASVLQAMYNGVIAVNAAGVVTIFNPAAARLLNRTQNEAVGHHCAEVLPEFGLDRIIAGGGPEVGRRLSIGGAVVIATSTPMSGPSGGIAGAITVLQDLTEFERIASELESVRKLHKTLDTILELAFDGIVVVDDQGIVTMANKALTDFLGARQEDVLGKHVTQVLDNTRLHLVAQTGVPEIGQVQVIRGNRFIVSRLPLIEEGRVVGAVGKVMFRGLNELKEIARRMETLENQLAYYKEELGRVSGARYTIESIVSTNPEMVKLKKIAQQAARSTSTVLITGESGTGKELFAHAIHHASPRRVNPFVRVNCAAIPENLLESEFFGYADGAFTGARKGGKPGKFELANGGTIFLDEIGDMSPSLQAKLLRVLQEKEIERVGGTSTIRVDVRIIAASNKDLEEMVAQGEFREDLFYRLNVITLKIPPLRERKEDILPLAHQMIGKFCQVLGVHVKGIAPEALAILQEYHWPGNVRELENVIERAMNLDVGDLIRPEHLPPHLTRRYEKNEHMLVLPGKTYRETLAEAEKRAILAALEKTGGNKAEAARALGISRSRFYEKLGKIGIPLKR
ncbi:MAG: sigma-54-dependent Fis family transcriptional regulator [Actinobacteria bacterium]|nr:sigma-54-dependent Fis family transcriptional regulator [Actinomycetota bacterium]